VGVNLVPELRARGWAVRTLGRRPLLGWDPDEVVHTRGDVRNRADVDRAMDGVDVVFHLAARITLSTHDAEAWSVNVQGPATVAQAALDHGVRRFVHCSSVHAFDLARSRPILDEHSPRSTDPDRPIYDRSKAAGEVEVRHVVEAGLDAVIVNPTGVIGPVDPEPTRANRVLLRAARGHLPVVVAGGFDWVDVRDVVLGLVAAADRGSIGENYLLPGHPMSALRLGRMVAGLNGHLGPLVAIPGRVARWIAPVGERIGGFMGSDSFTPASIGTLLEQPSIDGSKAERELGHTPRPLEDTLRDLVWAAAREDRTPTP
jgi:dihydroflavonol-4-reductase